MRRLAVVSFPDVAARGAKPIASWLESAQSVLTDVVRGRLARGHEDAMAADEPVFERFDANAGRRLSGFISDRSGQHAPLRQRDLDLVDRFGGSHLDRPSQLARTPLSVLDGEVSRAARGQRVGSGRHVGDLEFAARIGYRGRRIRHSAVQDDADAVERLIGCGGSDAAADRAGCGRRALDVPGLRHLDDREREQYGEQASTHGGLF